MIQLSIAYETLSDENRRTKYDATLLSSQQTMPSSSPAWAPQTAFDANNTTRMWQAKMQSRTWAGARRAQEKADQARREDDEYWSGPTYFHGAANHHAWGEKWDPLQSKHQERQRAARKDARREAGKKKRHTSTPPPRDPLDSDPEVPNAKAKKQNEEQEAWEKAEKDKHYDDGSWGKPQSPQQSEADLSERVQKEYQERQKKDRKERKEQSIRRKAQRELSERNWPAELLLLLSKIISIQVDIKVIDAEVDKSKKATKARYIPGTFPHLRLQSE